MTETRKTAAPARALGPWGTTARVMIGGIAMGSVVYGSVTRPAGFRPEAWLAGLIVLPGLFLGWQTWRARRCPAPFVVLAGPLGHLSTTAVFFLLYLTWWYAPPADFLSDAALLFFGTSMLVAAVRGHAGCEVLALSNWVLRRNDRLGCALFDPIDRAERPPEPQPPKQPQA
ncbi:hypothetical protein ABN028_05790 [Actinopolymorpha sp. B17G11]|uniref:hypothetical protein n=1 Tax=Actinopolymorpha sp. B17G11 TaxID=3160861 RepID=UPI0032E3F484